METFEKQTCRSQIWCVPVCVQPVQSVHEKRWAIALTDRENKFKVSRMGHSVKASLWCDSLSISTRFRSFILEWTIVKRIRCYIKTKGFQTTQGGYTVIIILPIKSKMAAAKKQCFFAFSVLNRVFTYRHLKSRFTNNYQFGISSVYDAIKKKWIKQNRVALLEAAITTFY